MSLTKSHHPDSPPSQLNYYVMFTALDALRLGFRTHLIADACRGVELKPGDVDRAIEEVRAAGGNVIMSDGKRLDSPAG
jgi:nicotinamidase-related amidase